MRKLSDMIVYIGKQKMYPLLIVFFLGIAFFFILGQLYYSVRKKAYCEKLERTFKEVLLRQLQEDSFEGYLSTSERKRQLEEYPDTVYLTDESGEHGYYLDREKSRRNIAHDPRLRILHSAYLVEHPLVVDSLYGKWQQHLEQQKMYPCKPGTVIEEFPGFQFLEETEVLWQVAQQGANRFPVLGNVIIIKIDGS